MPPLLCIPLWLAWENIYFVPVKFTYFYLTYAMLDGGKFSTRKEVCKKIR
jgi:hypothetical protein